MSDEVRVAVRASAMRSSFGERMKECAFGTCEMCGECLRMRVARPSCFLLGRFA